MAKRKKDLKTGTKRKKKEVKTRAPAKCRFCRLGTREVDYKDLPTLSKLTTAQGKIFSRKRSGNCAFHQRALRRAAKRARFIGLLPYVN